MGFFHFLIAYVGGATIEVLFFGGVMLVAAFFADYLDSKQRLRDMQKELDAAYRHIRDLVQKDETP
jgi:hypothetical protein